jgi:Reticulon
LSAFKLTCFAVTALAETVGKAAFGTGLATQLRPRKYFTIRKESLERVLDDLEQLINFAVIEFQRILFVENIWATTGVSFHSNASSMALTSDVLTLYTPGFCCLVFVLLAHQVASPLGPRPSLDFNYLPCAACLYQEPRVH